MRVRANEEETCGKKETSHLRKLEQYGGERKNEGKKKGKKRKERIRRNE